jgi:Tfp pilus assembly protein PilZ
MKASDRYFVNGVTCLLGEQEMRVANLSVGGLFAATEDPPMEGQFVSLQLRLGQRPPFTVLGKVTWINQPDNPKAHDLPRGFGIKITRIEFPDKLAILDLLKRSADHPSRLSGD